MTKELNSKAVTSRHRCQSFWDFPCPFWHNLTLHPVSRCKRTQNSQRAVVAATLCSFLSVKKKATAKRKHLQRVVKEPRIFWGLVPLSSQLVDFVPGALLWWRSSYVTIEGNKNNLTTCMSTWREQAAFFWLQKTARALVWKGLTIRVKGHNT